MPPHRRAVGFVFQEYALFPHLTAAGNVDRRRSGIVPRAERRSRARSSCSDRVQPAGQGASPAAANCPAASVSAWRSPGRWPVSRPSCFSTNRLPPSIARCGGALQDEIDALRRTLDIPLILVTHDFDDVVRLATHVLILEHGQGVAHGPVTTLMSRPDLAWLREAVGLGSVFEATVCERYRRSRTVRAVVRRRHAAGSRAPAPDRHGGPRPHPGPRGDPRDASARGAEPAQRPVRHRVGASRRSRLRPRHRPGRRRPRAAAGRGDARTRSTGWVSPSAAPVYALVKSVSIDVLTVETPIDRASSSGKLWSPRASSPRVTGQVESN